MLRAFSGFDRLGVDPDLLSGKPHVRGTRITVQRALEILSQYADRNELRRDYPGLDDEALRQVLAFAAAELGGKVVALERPAA